MKIINILIAFTIIIIITFAVYLITMHEIPTSEYKFEDYSKVCLKGFPTSVVLQKSFWHSGVKSWKYQAVFSSGRVEWLYEGILEECREIK